MCGGVAPHMAGLKKPAGGRCALDTGAPRQGSLLGKPFVIMEKIAGQVMGLLSSRHTGQQRELLTWCCTLFVQLHRLDWRPLLTT